MPKIRVLPDVLASQVAAGEVVERPASVVKELVENSIDAGSREVRVEMARGGAALIRVSDDGCGMSREDALLSLERHATSKLRTAGDLAAIRTLGFRGEAVPSIASVSRFRMVTREADAVAGTEILVEGGTVRDVRDAGCAPGTVIEAKSLFFNMPARRKFLRAETTESAHVEHQLRLHALAAPQVRFRLRRDEREVFDLPAVERSIDRVRQLVGPELAGELIALPAVREGGVGVEGFILPARHARKGRRHQYVFLNGRPVEDATISRALAEGFRGALSEGLHPAAWLWIDLEPGLVDVNVHPAKREVRFHRPFEIKSAILQAVAEGLKPPPPRVPGERLVSRPGAVEISHEPKATPVTVRERLCVPQPSLPGWLESSETPPAPPPVAPPAAPRFRTLGLLHQRFVLLESDDGLVIFDPRAAKERILYEFLLDDASQSIETQRLLIPALLEFDPRDLDLLLRSRQELSEAGVEVEGFGGNTLQVRGLPACLGVTEPREFLGAMLDELLHTVSPGPRFARDRVAKVMARRAASQVTARLAEVTELLEQLFRCELPYCAADGRPTLSEFSLAELERRMGNR